VQSPFAATGLWPAARRLKLLDEEPDEHNEFQASRLQLKTEPDVMRAAGSGE